MSKRRKEIKKKSPRTIQIEAQAQALWDRIVGDKEIKPEPADVDETFWLTPPATKDGDGDLKGSE